VRREGFEEVHDDFRASLRTFLAREVVGDEQRSGEWERNGIVPRELFARAGACGFLAMEVPEQYGGAGVRDFRLNAIVGEETQLAGVASVGLGITLHNDICLPYFLRYCSAEQRERWLPGIVAGELITAVAMTEPGTGSDLASIATRADADADGFLVNGAKTFITNGINADLVITAVKTDPSARHAGISLLVLERGMDGFSRGRNLEKVGQHGQDTAELAFADVRVPRENLLGEVGEGFRYLVANLPQERLSIALSAVAAAEAAFGWTLEYVRERRAFGQPIGSFQNSRFRMAELRGELDIAWAYVDRSIRALNAGELTAEDAASAKWWCTELQGRALDVCVQLHGGYGYVSEYPVARAWADARVTRIYGGTNEIMREIVGRSLGL
jgi:alkylation response protein AidB-like acyl-CoA dehydrogenase